MTPKQTLDAFDQWLQARGLSFQAVVVGGSALALLGIIDRPTRDVDVLFPGVSNDIAEAARQFAAEMSARGQRLDPDWVNAGPAQVAAALPAGWERRLRPLFDGEAIRLQTLAQNDLLLTKLFALCDRGTDLADCIALAPSADALRHAEDWLLQQDASEVWPALVRDTLRHLAQRLGHAL